MNPSDPPEMVLEPTIRYLQSLAPAAGPAVCTHRTCPERVTNGSPVHESGGGLCSSPRPWENSATDQSEPTAVSEAALCTPEPIGGAGTLTAASKESRGAVRVVKMADVREAAGASLA